MKKLLAVLGAVVMVLGFSGVAAEAATTVKFINLTTNVWGGEYVTNVYVIPPGTNDIAVAVTEPGAWFWCFGDPWVGQNFFDIGAFEEADVTEDWTYEVTVFYTWVPSDKGPEFPDEPVYHVDRQRYLTP